MAGIVSCVEQIAASIGMNCESPLVGGYTGRAVLIPISAIGAGTNQITCNVTRNIVQFGKAPSTPVLVAVDNTMVLTPFDGSQTAGSGDDGFSKFTKAFAFRIPERGAVLSVKVIEPLMHGGRFIAVLEKEQKVGDGGFEVVGLENSLRVVDPSTVTRQENANGGAWLVTLQCRESKAEYVIGHDNAPPSDIEYESAKAEFEKLWNACMNVE